MTFKQKHCKHEFVKIGWKNGFNIKGSDYRISRCDKCGLEKEEHVNLSEKYSISKEALLTKGEKILQQEKEEKEAEINNIDYSLLFETVCDNLASDSFAKNFLINKKGSITILEENRFLHKVFSRISFRDGSKDYKNNEDFKKIEKSIVQFLNGIGWKTEIGVITEGTFLGVRYYITIEVS